MIVAAAALALSIAAPSPMPPMIVNVTVAAKISPTLLTRITDEADAIWRGTGISFVWQHSERPTSLARRATPSFGPLTLRLVIGPEHGVSHEGQVALGWIVFEDNRPEQQIYLS